MLRPMHDPIFERTVQQKMEELQFHPADSVWVNIEKVVAGQRRRRGMPLFWRFALPVFLAAAATGVYYRVSSDRTRGVPTAGGVGASTGAVGASTRAVGAS